MIDHESDTRRTGSATGVAARALSALALLVIACFLARTAPDGDLWGHLTFGRDIVRTGHVHGADPYSFTSDRAWINHEWLAEAAMWIAYAIGATAGLVALKLLLACASGVALLATWRLRPPRPAVRDGMLFLTALGAWPLFATIRPQTFSVLFCAVLLMVLERARAGRIRWLLALPVIFAVWVNVHGGWIVGAGTLAIFVAFACCDRSLPARHRLLWIGAAAAAALATLCNPYGLSMLGFLTETVRPTRADIIEWQPATRVPLVGLLLWTLPTAIAAIAIWRQRRRPSLPSLVVVLLFAVGSFRVIRLVGFYALAVAFLLPPWVDDSSPDADAAASRRETSVAASARTVFACAALVAIAVATFGRTLAMDGDWLPEREAGAFIKSHDIRGRMLTWFDYGEFAIWHFSPAVRVSMDGRRETVYSEDLRKRHWDIYANAPDALAEVGRLDPDFVWLPASFGVVPRLEAAGWQPIFAGPRSVVLSRRPAVAIAAPAVPSAPRTFPGP